VSPASYLVKDEAPTQKLFCDTVLASVPMREFISGISGEMLMFFSIPNPEKNQSWDRENLTLLINEGTFNFLFSSSAKQNSA
jgi:hypothetical protein